MKKIYNIWLLSLGIIFFLSSCEKDSKNGNTIERDFIIAFEEQSIAYGDITDSKDLFLVFSEIALVDGSVELDVSSVNATNNIDFKTNPETTGGTVTIPFHKGDKKVSLDFINLIYPFDRSDKTVEFRIKNINYTAKPALIQGYDVMLVSFDTALGGVLQPPVGGPSESMQVYVDLGGKAMYPVQRDSWDLGFYNGTEFRVKLNGSIYMAAGNLTATDIDKVKESDFENLKKAVQIGTFDPANIKYIDQPTGDITSTAISAISVNDADNKVYLLNLGFEPGPNDVAKGSVSITGKSRGWKKVRILQRDGKYLLQYADLNSTTHQEVVIEKNAAYNFTNFSFNTNSVVSVEPSKTKWDLNFTVFTNTVDQQGDPKGSYGFSDFIINNRYGGVVSYKVTIENNDKSFYKNFSLADVEESKLALDLRTIGGTWRDVTNEKILYKNIFYVIKDSKGNFYKMRVLSFLNDQGERGYPKFEYSLLR